MHCAGGGIVPFLGLIYIYIRWSMIECMSMKQVWMGIAVCLCLSCTRMRGGQEGVVLDLTETGTDTLGFGDVFDVVGVVPLETKNECLLGHVSKVEVVDGNYYVLDGQRKAVFVFDGQGAFLRRIGIMGHGHGEYERASDFTVDRDRRRVVILCGPGRYICMICRDSLSARRMSVLGGSGK